VPLEVEGVYGEAASGQVGQNSVEDVGIELKRLLVLAANRERNAAGAVERTVVRRLDAKHSDEGPIPGSAEAGR
jgi:hypothetical protein